MSLKNLPFLLIVLPCLSLSFSVRAAELTENWTNVTAYAAEAASGDWSRAVARAIAEAGEDGTVFMPKNEYVFASPLALKSSVSLLFQRGAVVKGDLPELIRIEKGGRIVFEGLGGKAILENTAAGGVVISLDSVVKDEFPSLCIRNLRLKGDCCLSGYRNPDKGAMGDVEVLDCHFEADNIHMGHKFASVRSLLVKDSLFTGKALKGIFFISPMPGGAVVRGNVLKDVGVRAIQLSGEKFTIADGCVNYLPNAIVHDNQILGGGHRSTIANSYILGILVYGHNVSIQGNIVRDFNRGEPVEEGKIGHHVRGEDGQVYRGAWIKYGDNSRRRLAGAAIYAKARQLIISNNICTNSGYRAVIEVKTGGKEPYSLVSNNVVDGRSLAVDGSFGFECNSNRSVWTGNLVYDMPDTAFMLRSFRENTFTNNVIFNAKIAFKAPTGEAGATELIANNRLVNVQNNLSYIGASKQEGVLGAVSAPMPTLVVRDEAFLPRPSDSLRGQLALLLGEREDRLLLCSKEKGAVSWQDFNTAGATAPRPVWQPVAGTQEDLKANDASAWVRRVKAGSVKTKPGFSAFAPDAGQFGDGRERLRIAHAGEAFSWTIARMHKIDPGVTYRFSARVFRNSRKPTAELKAAVVGRDKSALEVARSSCRAHSRWEDVTVDFTVPEDYTGKGVHLSFSGTTSGGEDEDIWLESFSLCELQRVD